MFASKTGWATGELETASNPCLSGSAHLQFGQPLNTAYVVLVISRRWPGTPWQKTASNFSWPQFATIVEDYNAAQGIVDVFAASQRYLLFSSASTYPGAMLHNPVL